MKLNRIFMRKRSVKSGLPPGTMVHVGAVPDEPAVIRIIDYTPDAVREQTGLTVEPALFAPGRPGVVWINVEGVHNVEFIRTVGESCSLHPLVLEDIVNTVQRPKIEDYGSYLFIVFRMLKQEESGDFTSEQVSVVLSQGYLITFQEGFRGDVFDGVRERIRSGKGKIRGMGSDYLAYALIDAVVDSYFTVLEEMGEHIVNLEEELTRHASPFVLRSISTIRKEVIFLRKTAWPLREAVSFLERGDSPLLNHGTRIYFRDVYDHTIQVMDSVETYRDLLAGMFDLYLTSVSNRTNDVMKFLTVIGTIFLPLTFLVGIYGMNFKNMPELEWRYGYFLLWGLMLLLTGVMIFYFKRKRWL